MYISHKTIANSTKEVLNSSFAYRNAKRPLKYIRYRTSIEIRRSFI